MNNNATVRYEPHKLLSLKSTAGVLTREYNYKDVMLEISTTMHQTLQQAKSQYDVGPFVRIAGR